MSFDLTIFDPAEAPRDEDGFDAWLERAEDGTWAVTDELCTDPLKRFYAEVASKLRPLNGPGAPSDAEVDDVPTGDYSLSRAIIEVSLATSTSEQIVAAIPQLAEKHGLGLYDPQGGEVYFPTGPGGSLEVAFEL